MGQRNQSSYYSKPIARIHADFNGICALCGGYVELKDASRDHIIPRSEGGGNGRDNIQLTHKKCNNLKGNTIYPKNWREQLQREMVIPQGYRCRYCELPITNQHKKHKWVAKVINSKGRVEALHSWCDQERIKYGKR